MFEPDAGRVFFVQWLIGLQDGDEVFFFAERSGFGSASDIADKNGGKSRSSEQREHVTESERGLSSPQPASKLPQ